jgi:hypothetical protein
MIEQYKKGDKVRANRQGAKTEEVLAQTGPMVTTYGNVYHHSKIVRVEEAPDATRTSPILFALGYRLIDDSRGKDERLTYLHDENADRPLLLALSHSLRYAGWQTDDAVPPVYRMPGTRFMIEIEPGGADTSGHYLHLIKIGD